MRTRMPGSAERWNEIGRLLDDALDRAPAERSALLDRECARDPELRAAVERLLLACESSAGFLEGEPAVHYAAPLVAASMAERRTPSPLDATGLRVGPYRVVREAGHGGMGIVYLAERADDQYRQQVALKLMRGGALFGADDHLSRRFLEERQILATLEHPGIARLLDGGVTGDGLPWFAMEYVAGVPIDRYCDERRLTIEERLTLFCSICDAVAFAHRNLVVHRDLKPSNILVASDGTVKLLDFGIARLLAPLDGDGSAAPATRTVLRALTPEYASPEELRGERVSTASDVYSLGIVLCELLAGRRPYEGSRRTPHEIERAILESNPVPPSVLVSRLASPAPDAPPDASLQRTAEALSEARRLTPDRLRRTLRGDLDAIVLTATRKEPERRYASADQLADDVRRYLHGMPVMARVDGPAYRASKFILRHRTGVAAAVAAAAVLLVFSIVTTVQSARLRGQSERITLERDRAQEVSGFLVSLFRSADPFAGEGPRTTVREVLDSGAARVDRELSEQPELRAELLRAMGLSYLNLGLTTDARRLLEAALAIPRQATNEGEPHEVSVRHSLAQVLQEQGELANAESLYRDVLAWRRRSLPSGHRNLARSLTTLATVVSAQGRYAEGERLAREALAIDQALRPAEPPLVAQSLNNLGNILHRQRRYTAAESTHREAYVVRHAAFGDDHAETANSLVNIAAALGGQQRYAEAESLFRRGLAIKRRRLGARHSDVATDEAGFARMLHLKGDDLAAEALYRHAIDIHRSSRPAGHPRTAHAMLGLGELLLARGEARAAEPFAREALQSFRHTLPAGHPSIESATRILSACLTRLGRVSEALALQNSRESQRP